MVQEKPRLSMTELISPGPVSGLSNPKERMQKIAERMLFRDLSRCYMLGVDPRNAGVGL